MHEKKMKGDLAVAQVIARLTELGWNVGVLITEHAPYDLFAENGGKVHTVQVRYVTPSRGQLHIKLDTSWADRRGNHRRPRQCGQFSLLAAYSPGLGVFFVSDEGLGRNVKQVTLRLTPAGNGQFKGIRMAEDFRQPRPLAAGNPNPHGG